MALVFSNDQPSLTLRVPGLAPRFNIVIRQATGRVDHPTAITHAMTRADFTVQLQPGEEGLIFGFIPAAKVLMPDGSIYSAVCRDPQADDDTTICDKCDATFRGTMALAQRGRHMKREHDGAA